MKKQEREQLLAEMYEVIRKNPGIRAMEVCKAVSRDHCGSFRQTLIDRGLVKKVKDGNAVKYYSLQ